MSALAFVFSHHMMVQWRDNLWWCTVLLSNWRWFAPPNCTLWRSQFVSILLRTSQATKFNEHQCSLTVFLIKSRFFQTIFHFTAPLNWSFEWTNNYEMNSIIIIIIILILCLLPHGLSCLLLEYIICIGWGNYCLYSTVLIIKILHLPFVVKR